MSPEERADEEVDVKPYEGEPDFDESPSRNLVSNYQDVDFEEVTGTEVEQLPPLVEGEALGDDLAPPTPKEVTPDA